ncbi:MAG: hypothetical protein WC985_04920, partial [Thermoplasmata archaeon]
ETRIRFVLMGSGLTGGHRVLLEIVNGLAARGHAVAAAIPATPLPPRFPEPVRASSRARTY